MKGSKILIVEDSKTFLLYIDSILKNIANTQLIKVQDPLNAIAVAELEKPAVIMTDFEMPNMLGSELVKKFRNHPQFMATPIIMMTSHEGDKSLVRAISSGANDYLCKSSTEEVILIKIKRLIEYQKLLQADMAKRELMAVHGIIARVNHEFNNTLCISSLTIQKLKKELDHPLIHKLEETNNRMLEVVHKLNDLSKVEIPEGDSLDEKMVKL